MARFTGVLDQPVVAVAVDCTAGPVEAILTQPAATGATTIAAGSDGAELPQATINVASTIGTGVDEPFATSGVVLVASTVGENVSFQTVTYTGKTNTSFTGCTGGVGILATGNTVTGNHLVAWTGVDRWLTADGNPPVLHALANAVDHFTFEDIGGVVYGRHKNAPGLSGNRGSAGTVGLQNRGTYAPATAYVLNDVVSYLGSTYICIQAGTGQTPTTTGTAFWDLMALAGATGPPIVVITPGTPTTSLDQAGVAARPIEWSSWTVYQYTDAQLTYMGSTLGIYGLWLSNALAPGTLWSGNPNTVPAGSVQASVMANNTIARARSKGIQKFYLGFRASIPTGTGRTPFHVDWFNDAGWTNTVIPAIKDFAGAAKLMGADGVGFDGEEYGMNNGLPPSWLWNYPGNTHTEAEVRAKVKQRGAEIMTAMLSVFPNLEMIAYYANFDGGFNALIQNVVNGKPLNNFSTTQVSINFWDGLTSVSGYSRIRLQESAFYRGTTDITGSPDLRTCMTLNVNGQLAYLSQNLSNWAYANQRLSISPMSWLGPTNGDGAYTAANSNTASQALALVQAARIHGMSGEFANFALEKANTLIPPAAQNYADFTSTNGHLSHANFVPAYSAAPPGVVDTTDPTLSSIVVTRDSASTVHATGIANDNLGVRAIRWVSGPSTGAAAHTFVVDSGGSYQTAYASFAWHITWTATGIPATAGQTITFVVEDIKGRAASYTAVAPA